MEKLGRKMQCRYGRGCTHINDPIHQERFWHPPLPLISEEQRKTHYFCNECGYATPSLEDLQIHLIRKTAWSNSSLVGCKISCFVDNKEWHEGFVAQFHSTGKHLVEFRLIGESKWLNMKKMAFFIIERPRMAYSSEFKESENESETYANEISFEEELSLDYAFAQSVLFKIFGSVVQETGHKTRGHLGLTDEDRELIPQSRGSLLYGELLPRGANKAFSSARLSAKDATVVFDLGMGTGKIAIQAFLQFRNLHYVYGVELSCGRYSIAEEAVLRMIELLGTDTFKIQNFPGRYIIVTETLPDRQHDRVLHMECGDMFDVKNIDAADIIMLETDIPLQLHPNLCSLLDRMHVNARTLTYLDLRKIWTGTVPFRQIDTNRHNSDRYPTSWSVQRGHHFYLWEKNIAYVSKVESLCSESPLESGDDERMEEVVVMSKRCHSPVGCFSNLSYFSIFQCTGRREKKKKVEVVKERIIPVKSSSRKSSVTSFSPQLLEEGIPSDAVVLSERSQSHSHSQSDLIVGVIGEKNTS